MSVTYSDMEFVSSNVVSSILYRINCGRCPIPAALLIGMGMVNAELNLYFNEKNGGVGRLKKSDLGGWVDNS